MPSGFDHRGSGFCAAGQAGGFSPSSLPGLISWYRSDLGVTIETGVSSWMDLSGGGNHLLQPVAAEQPTLLTNQLDGHPAIRFDGIDDHLLSLTVPAASPRTIYIVFKLRAYSNDAVIFAGNAYAVGWYQLGNSGNNAYALNGVALLNSTLLINTYCLATIIFDGVSSVVQINSLAETTGNSGANIPEGFSLGASALSTNPSQIDVCDIIIQDAHASAQDRIDVKSYVLARYGI